MNKKLLILVILSLFTVILSSFANGALTDKLFAYYEFEEDGSNSTLGDSAGLHAGTYGRDQQEGGAGSVDLK